MTLREQIQSDMKDAMRAHDAAKLSAIRMLWSSVKQKEVDERITADDSVITAIIAKAVKERHDSIEQYRKGGREDLAAKEQSEIDVFTAYLPKPLSEEEINQGIDRERRRFRYGRDGQSDGPRQAQAYGARRYEQGLCCDPREAAPEITRRIWRAAVRGPQSSINALSCSG